MIERDRASILEQWTADKMVHGNDSNGNEVDVVHDDVISPRLDELVPPLSWRAEGDAEDLLPVFARDKGHGGAVEESTSLQGPSQLKLYEIAGEGFYNQFDDDFDDADV